MIMDDMLWQVFHSSFAHYFWMLLGCIMVPVGEEREASDCKLLTSDQYVEYVDSDVEFATQLYIPTGATTIALRMSQLSSRESKGDNSIKNHCQATHLPKLVISIQNGDFP